MLYANCREAKFGTVASVDTKRVVFKRPNGLNLIDVLKMAIDEHEMEPLDTLRHLEQLYNKGFISYPRTMVRNYPA